MSDESKDKDSGEMIEMPVLPSIPEPPKHTTKLPPRPKVDPSEDAQDYHRLGIAMNIPASLVAPIIALTLGGAWLDGKLRLTPDFTLLGALLGVICGFLNMFRIVEKLNK